MSEKSEKITRRDFLKMLSVVTAGAFLGTGMHAASRNSGPETVARPETMPSSEQLVFDENGVRVWFRDGFPHRWEDRQAQGIFNQDQIRAAIEQANAESRPTVAQVLRIETGREQVATPPTDKSESEAVTALPENALSNEELAQRGIEILGTPNVGLQLRRSAFTKGGLLEQQALDGQQRLKILITDKPSVTREAFLDERYQSERSAIERGLISAAQDAATILPTRIQAADEVQRQLRTQAVSLLTVQEICDWGLLGASGYAFGSEHRLGAPNTSYVFLAIPTTSTRPADFECLQLLYTPPAVGGTGFQVSIEAIPIEETFSLNPVRELQPNQSYTNPEEYKTLERHPEGSFQWKMLAGIDPQTKDPYFVATHELVHTKNYFHRNSIQTPLEGTAHTKFFSEQETDFATLELLTRAYKTYQETGDDSDYPLVLENKREGYYVIG